MLDMKKSVAKISESPQGQSIDWSFWRKYSGLTALLTLLVFSSNGLSLAIPRLVGQVIDQLDGSVGSLTEAWQEVRIILIIAFGALTFSIGQAFLAAKIAERVARDFRERLIDKISGQSVAFVDSFDPGRLYTIVTSDTEAVKNIISMGLVNVLSALIILVGSVILIFTIDVRLSFVAVISLPLMVGVFGWVFVRISQYFRRSQEVLERVNRVVNENILGAMLIRVLASRGFEEQKFQTVNSESRDVGYAIINLFSILLPAVNLLSNLTIAAILWFGGRRVIAGDLSVGDFSAFVSYVNLLVTPIFILGFVSNVISRSFVSLRRIGEILNAPEQVIPEGGYVGPLRGDIEFVDVCLQIGGRQVLKDISFRFEAGKRNALVGPTAAGKTLLLSLMAGLIEPTSGSIKVDGVEVTDWDRKELYAQVGLVFQESVLFRASLKENILFDREISQERLDEILRVAHLDDVIRELDDGLETIVSERGSNLSGGQKQRVMLARALAIDPKVLLLDDFTARVDQKTEGEILERLEQAFSDITLISISQKLSSVQDFDSIVLVMEGECIDQGTHDEMLQRSLEYRQIWDSQQTS
jgi:ATP-binding cassette subfamily B protein